MSTFSIVIEDERRLHGIATARLEFNKILEQSANRPIRTDQAFLQAMLERSADEWARLAEIRESPQVVIAEKEAEIEYLRARLQQSESAQAAQAESAP